MSAKLHEVGLRLGSIAAFALLAFNHPLALPKQASVPDDLFRWASLNEAELWMFGLDHHVVFPTLGDHTWHAQDHGAPFVGPFLAEIPRCRIVFGIPAEHLRWVDGFHRKFIRDHDANDLDVSWWPA